jgi:hypothetical protein
MMPVRAGHVVQDVRRRWPARRRLALGLSPVPRPGLVLLLFGIAIGPQGLGLLSPPVLASLDPVVSVALAALGVFAGLATAVRKGPEQPMFGASHLLAAATMIIVGAGVLVVERLSPGAGQSASLIPLVVALCAVSSSTAEDSVGDARHAAIVGLGNAGDVLPIVLSTIAFGLLREGPVTTTVWIAVQSVLIALTIAAATALLVAQTASDSEQRVFAFGALLLLGGAAAHLSLSALFMGLLAGACWKLIGPPACDALVRDVRYLQDPLLVLVLVVAGALAPFPGQLAGLVLAYVIFRIAGKLMAGWIVTRTMARDLPADLGLHLVAPGVIGVALALNVRQAFPNVEAATGAFAIVVLGSLASDLLSLVAPAREGQE